jgi:hypothetical protein
MGYDVKATRPDTATNATRVGADSQVNSPQRTQATGLGFNATLKGARVG